jgi:DNA-3-methyladenine glycosylase
MPRRLTRSFYNRATLDVARDLIGCVLVHVTPTGRLAARIVETEAYVGPDDRASHASRGRTPRTEIMFGVPGHAYIYLVYGMHHCLNVVTEPEGFPAAVLIRAAEPLGALAGENASGPGRLCRLFGIDRRLDGCDMTRPPLFIAARDGRTPTIATSPRVGVAYAGAWAGKPWRFYAVDSAAVSRPGKARRVV